jgi:protein-tyrosine phosphatase
VRAEIKKENLPIEIEAAAEYQLEPEFEEKLEKEKLLTFGDNYLLFELPFFSEPPSLSRAVFQMQTKGYKPVLAHVERYTFWHGNTEKVEELFDRGVILQLNINSLSGNYGPEVKKMAELCVDKGWIRLLGSDCHRTDHLTLLNETRKKPYLHKALNLDLLNRKL